MDKYKKLSKRETQLKLSEMLFHFDEMCTNLGLSYVIASGTLLGAIRHKGFIPWDDDVDVFMLRKDYEMFCRYCIQNKDRIQPYRIENYDTNPSCDRLFTRLLCRDFMLVWHNKVFEDVNLFIDIFPVDNLGEHLLLAKLKYRFSFLAANIVDLNMISDSSQIHQKGKTFKKILYPFARIIGLRKARGLHHRIATMNNERTGNRYVGNCAYGGYGIEKEIQYAEDVSDRTQVLFEGRKVWAPKNYDRVLKRFYGDYMKLPPVNEREDMRHGYEGCAVRVTNGEEYSPELVKKS